MAIKALNHTRFKHEVEITQMFSEEPLASDPHNHCIPVYDVLRSPFNGDITFMVMPWLIKFYNFRMDTYGEAVDCVQQLIEVCLAPKLPVLELTIAWY